MTSVFEEFNIYLMIEQETLVQALQALAHEARLGVYLALVEAGPAGLPAGALAERLGIGSSALSFHLTRLRHAGLVASTREGQRIVYSACCEQVAELTDFLRNRCCRSGAAACEEVCEGRSRAGVELRLRRHGAGTAKRRKS